MQRSDCRAHGEAQRTVLSVTPTAHAMASLSRPAAASKVLDATRSVQDRERQRLEAQSALLQNRVALCRALAGSWTLARPEAVS